MKIVFLPMGTVLLIIAVDHILTTYSIAAVSRKTHQHKSMSSRCCLQLIYSRFQSSGRGSATKHCVVLGGGNEARRRP